MLLIQSDDGRGGSNPPEMCHKLVSVVVVVDDEGEEGKTEHLRAHSHIIRMRIRWWRCDGGVHIIKAHDGAHN